MNRATLTARLCAAYLLIMALTACTARNDVTFPPGSTMDKLNKAGRITVGIKFDQPGLGFLNPATGKPEGFDIKIAEIIAGELGLKPDQIYYKETVSENREQLLKSGRVDIVVASYSITADRQQEVGQAGPYYLTHTRLLVREADKETFKPDNLSGVKVCSASGSTSIKLAREKYKAQPVEYKTYTECVYQLQRNSGAVDAVLTDDAVLLGYAAQQPDKLEVVGEPTNEERYGIGYTKDDHAFCQFLTNTIKKAQENGDWDKAFTETLGKAGAPAPPRPPLNPCPT